MRKALLIGLAFLVPEIAHAQALGSVNCRAQLRKLEAELSATQRRIEGVKDASADEFCAAAQVRLYTLERAATLYDRCTEGDTRDTHRTQTLSALQELRDSLYGRCE